MSVRVIKAGLVTHEGFSELPNIFRAASKGHRELLTGIEIGFLQFGEASYNLLLNQGFPLE